MKTIKVVIGANFGDEGKGQMTEYFADKAIRNGESCLVVCHNGSAQKGHTCIADDGSRHIFHHFGSGTLVGADTYFSKDFVVNPMFFKKEYEELKDKGLKFKVYVNPKCCMAIPYDIMINQEIEVLRGNKKHGSCGYGFFESVVRNKKDEYKTNVEDAYHIKSFKETLQKISDEYIEDRCKELDMQSLRDDFKTIIYDSLVIDTYIEDVKFFLNHVIFITDDILKDYDTMVFEGSQGLMLDEDNVEYFPHLTPSHTGLLNPYRIITGLNLDCSVEVCYVTRTYLTRHGAGRLDHECKKEDINPEMTDLTNVPNKFQETLRYAKLNIPELKNRILKDFSIARKNDNFKLSIAVMHENEYFVSGLEDEKYHSNGPRKENIYINKKITY